VSKKSEELARSAKNISHTAWPRCCCDLFYWIRPQCCAGTWTASTPPRTTYRRQTRKEIS